MMPYANYRAIPALVRDRKPFEGNTMSGTDQSSRYQSGRLNETERDRLIHDMPFIRYMVFSYSTPIAWWSTKTGWYKVGQRFSVTTSKHQSKLYLIPHPVPVPSFDCETYAYALSDCKHWGKPGTECAGPRVGATPSGVILCERHFNQ
jgi:hypothetical protein